MKRKVTNAKLVLPELEYRKVWAGLYGGHYDVIVFFSKKPAKAKEAYRKGWKVLYDCLENEKLIVGDMSLCDFRTLYPNVDLTPYTQENGRPKEIEVTEIFQLNLQCTWDKYGKMEDFRFHNDW